MSMVMPTASTSPQASGMKIEHMIGITIIILLAIDVYIEYLMLKHMQGQGGTIKNESGPSVANGRWGNIHPY